MPQHGGILCWFPLTPCIPKLMPQMTLFFSASAFFLLFVIDTCQMLRIPSRTLTLYRVLLFFFG